MEMVSIAKLECLNEDLDEMATDASYHAVFVTNYGQRGQAMQNVKLIYQVPICWKHLQMLLHFRES